MYNGNHPTALNSQKMLLEALNDLLREKNYKDISVSEICSHSGISRQTFYTLFGTKENLIRYQIEQSALAQSPKDPNVAQVTLSEYCDSYSEFIISNYRQFEMLVENDLMDILNTFIFQTMASCRQSFMNAEGTEREYASLFISAGLCHLTKKYIQEHPVPNQEELASLTYKVMSGNIYKKD